MYHISYIIPPYYHTITIFLSHYSYYLHHAHACDTQYFFFAVYCSFLETTLSYYLDHAHGCDTQYMMRA